LAGGWATRWAPGEDSFGNHRVGRLNLNQNEQKFFGSFFKKEQKKALFLEKRNKNFLPFGCLPCQPAEAFIYRQALRPHQMFELVESGIGSPR
jgi:hypothetical protein